MRVLVKASSGESAPVETALEAAPMEHTCLQYPQHPKDLVDWFRFFRYQQSPSDGNDDQTSG